MQFFNARGERSDNPSDFRRIALIDGDLWTYDIPFAAQPAGREPLGFSFVRSCIETRIDEVLRATGADGFSFFLTGHGNFRDAISTRTRYKGNRKQPKPYHYKNARLYLEHQYQADVSNGWEADDRISAILHGGVAGAFGITCGSSRLEAPEYVCVSRDKDLRTVPGLHYGYRCGLQPEIPLHEVSELGHLELSVSGNKLRGDGLKFFYAQTLMGDSTDNIPGCPGVGPQRTYHTLVGCSTEKEMFEAALEQYALKFEDPRAALLEQGRLAWMTREFRDGQPVLWELPE